MELVLNKGHTSDLFIRISQVLSEEEIVKTFVKKLERFSIKYEILMDKRHSIEFYLQKDIPKNFHYEKPKPNKIIMTQQAKSEVKNLDIFGDNRTTTTFGNLKSKPEIFSSQSSQCPIDEET